ncbi:mechanosensitive ion channel domain-containing protein [Haloarculaceae archaeon H-GB2-1]|nr:mechanosensitive ion channel [Haloarculaceae archaeon H-GB1-1]MEA5407526.1 mechanosensitive ion channel domain-containing protein [Haloarculaceae archaeon H-GB2-1]
MIDWFGVLEQVFANELNSIIAIGVLFVGLVAGYTVWRMASRMLQRMGIPELVEGTVFERTARGLGTSTVGILALMAALFVYAGALVIALSISRAINTQLFWAQVTGYFPSLFVAALALIVSLVIGDKAKLVVSERLRSVKLPEVGLIPELVKYSIFYVGGLVALGQLGVVTEALLILLGVYAFGIVLLGGFAFKDLLAAGAAGVYLVLTEPYSIGDEVRIDEHEGIVQEVDVFVTYIESDGEEYIVPNQLVLQSSIVRVRN